MTKNRHQQKKRHQANSSPNGNNSRETDNSDLQSILKDTPKLILARRVSKALVDVSKGLPLSVKQARDVLKYVQTYLESHPDMNLEQGLPEVVSEPFP